MTYIDTVVLAAERDALRVRFTALCLAGDIAAAIALQPRMEAIDAMVI